MSYYNDSDRYSQSNRSSSSDSSRRASSSSSNQNRSYDYDYNDNGYSNSSGRSSRSSGSNSSRSSSSSGQSYGRHAASSSSQQSSRRSSSGSDYSGQRRAKQSDAYSRQARLRRRKRNRRIFFGCIAAIVVVILVVVIVNVNSDASEEDLSEETTETTEETETDDESTSEDDSDVVVEDDELTEEELAAIEAEEEAEAELAAQVEALEAELDEAVAAIEAEGYTVGYIAMDVDGTDTIEFNADTIYYSASSIKGPFCVSLVRTLGWDVINSYGDTITTCLRDSNNVSYDTLQNAYYGTTVWSDYFEAAGVTTIETEHWYAHYSARDLAKLWAEGAEFLTSGEDTAEWLGDILNDTIYSTVDDIAGADGTETYSKAGWYFDGGEEYDGTVDGGIVAAESGTFVVAVMTNKPYDFDAIYSVMEPLIELWELTHTSE